MRRRKNIHDDIRGSVHAIKQWIDRKLFALRAKPLHTPWSVQSETTYTLWLISKAETCTQYIGKQHKIILQCSRTNDGIGRKHFAHRANPLQYRAKLHRAKPTSGETTGYLPDFRPHLTTDYLLRLAGATFKLHSLCWCVLFFVSSYQETFQSGI